MRTRCAKNKQEQEESCDNQKKGRDLISGKWYLIDVAARSVLQIFQRRRIDYLKTKNAHSIKGQKDTYG